VRSYDKGRSHWGRSELDEGALGLKKRFSVLFVCTGNTCRSPLAEVMMKNALAEAGVKHVMVSSAGTAAIDGAKPSGNAGLVARRFGLSLAGFRSRQLTRRRMVRADLILTMGLAQKEEIARRLPEASDKTFVISEFSRSGRKSIQDPMGHSEEVYLKCAGELSDEVKRILPKIRRRLKARRQKT
jgi:protein-tyrosine phosphatase